MVLPFMIISLWANTNHKQYYQISLNYISSMLIAVYNYVLNLKTISKLIMAARLKWEETSQIVTIHYILSDHKSYWGQPDVHRTATVSLDEFTITTIYNKLFKENNISEH